ncbi:hypothetical protein NC651_027810 [Populus alba x Populus x berolinensis]|nr:hypothetical protein NC651_027810 [Populus alba x Populus x berolinensis]
MVAGKLVSAALHLSGRYRLFLSPQQQIQSTLLVNSFRQYMFTKDHKKRIPYPYHGYIQQSHSCHQFLLHVFQLPLAPQNKITQQQHMMI